MRRLAWSPFDQRVQANRTFGPECRRFRWHERCDARFHDISHSGRQRHMTIDNSDHSSRPARPVSPGAGQTSGSRHRLIQTGSLLVLAIFAVAYGLYFTRAVMLPVVVAVVLNFVLSPMVARLGRIGCPPMLGAGIVLGLLAAVVAFGVLQLQRPAAKWIRNAPTVLPEIQRKLKALEQPVRQLTEASDSVEEIAKSSDEVVKVAVQQPSLASELVSKTGSFAGSMLLAGTLLFFLLSSGDQFLAKCVELMPTLNDKRRVVKTFREIQSGIGHYLGTVTIINLFLGIIIGITLWFFGVPNAALWGVMATLLNYVPFLGLIVGAAVIFLVSLVSFDTLGQAAAPPIAYIIINGIEANLVTPAILGRSMSMNPVAILLWMTAWGWMWGIVGAILAVPLLAIVKIACEEVESLTPIAKFIDS